MLVKTYREFMSDECTDIAASVTYYAVLALFPDDEVIGTVIGATVLDCEAGQVRGRVAFDENSQVVGILLVPMDHGPLPF